MTLSSRFFQKKESQIQEPQNWKQALFRDFKDILYILVCFLFIYTLLFRIVVVDGGSMNQTLIDGDRVFLVSNALYRNPKQGDIVVISKDSFRDGECIVKRVIATEGQTVDIDFERRIVYVDGVALEESYVFFRADYDGPMIRNEVSFPLTVEEGCIFVLGDNRNNSTDSRDPDIGQIDCREVLGKALFLIIPGTDDGNVPADFSRIGGLY